MGEKKFSRFWPIFERFTEFPLKNVPKLKIRKKFASRKGSFLTRNQTLIFARIAKIRKVWQHWERPALPVLISANNQMKKKNFCSSLRTEAT